MSKFSVKTGKKPRPATGGPEAPPERKPIHPGLLQVATQLQCRACGQFLVWKPFGNHMIDSCACGIWMQDARGLVRWVRWSSESFMPGGQQIFAPAKK